MSAKFLISAGVALTVLAGCTEEDLILPGERFDLRAQAQEVNQVRAVSLTSPRANADWTHRNGDADHLIPHPALGSNLQPVFVTAIGEGDSRRARITADPVVAGGVIYTLDARATVSATSTAGQLLWQRNVAPGSDNLSDASGGGLAVSGGQLYVTSAFGAVTALDAASGETRWVQDLDAPALAPPTVRGGLVYVIARDSTAWALEPTNGRVQWQVSGTPSTANFSSGAAPAVNDSIAILPFPSGEIIATFPEGGLRRWSSVISGERLGRAASVITDIGGDPVIEGNRVYVANFGGRVAAFDTFNGDRLWTAGEGAISPVWPAGGSLFLVNDLNQLVRLDASTGQPIWRTSLPTFRGENTRRQNRIVAHYGPILAGGRLIVASSDGVIRQFDPRSGGALGDIAIEGGAASHPVVAGQTLYVVSKTGQLHAFR
ncbi:PQQ-binding-like beta-propeller repeat protein [Yoonia sp. SS1-5]|uniref:PQQ-binding-like beta-propeller repeat protein n=1 Tax=Yoonia rhodophyticola TaxID=3137370 RepID=A0AAN0MAX4_9RHOB